LKRAAPHIGTAAPPYRLLAAYALPAVPLALAGIPLYIYLPTFYAEHVGLDLKTVGGVLLLARLWDVLTDPLVGILSDRTHSRFGRRRPWLAAGAFPTALAIFMLFLPPPGVGSRYLLGWSLLLYAGWTMITVPQQSWGAELSDDYHQRTRVAAWREGGLILGTVLATGLPILLGDDLAQTLSVLAWIAVAALPITVLVAVSQVPDHATTRAPIINRRQSWLALAGNRPFRRLLVAYLVNGVANGLPATLFMLFVGHVIDAADRASVLLFVYLLSGVLAIPFWVRLSFRLGKHRTWAVAMLWVCGVFIVVPFLGSGDFSAFFVVCVLSGFGLGADLVLPAAMQADVIDIDRRQTGARRTGLYFALWSMATKLALAAAVGIGFPLLQAAGFVAGAQNTPQALAALSYLYALLPLACKLVSVALVWNFPLGAEHPTQPVGRPGAELA
jgi:Na+/melibiose symporter-like transporter